VARETTQAGLDSLTLGMVVLATTVGLVTTSREAGP